MKDKIEFIFCKELQDDLLKGSVIIWNKTTPFLGMILVRLPKERFEKIPDGREFEYKIYYQRVEENMYHGTWKNGHIRTIKKDVLNKFWKTNFSIKKAIDHQKKP